MTSQPSAQVSNMASGRVLERAVQEEPRRAATANLDFCQHKYSLLIIVGRTAHPRQTEHTSREIERGTYMYFDPPLSYCTDTVSLILPHSVFGGKTNQMLEFSSSSKSSPGMAHMTLLQRLAICNVIHPMPTEDASSGDAPPSASPHPCGHTSLSKAASSGCFSASLVVRRSSKGKCGRVDIQSTHIALVNDMPLTSVCLCEAVTVEAERWL